MVDFSTVRSKIEASLAAKKPAFENDQWVILDHFTIERDWGWVFFWHSRKYQETRDFKYQIAGNAPFIVRRSDGEILSTGTARRIEDYITDYIRDKKLP